MFPQPMSRPELFPEDMSADPASILEQHIRAGFPPDLALDLVLNEVVVRASEATRATAAALALKRGDEMVCRAATGHLAPDLGVPLNTHDGLSGACLRMSQPQLSVDTEFDPRVDPVVSRRLGIRSILIVPIFEAENNTQIEGMLEVLSSSPATFSHNDQKVLEAFAEECARIRQAAAEIKLRLAPSRAMPMLAAEVIPAEILPAAPESRIAGTVPSFASGVMPNRRSSYELWSLVLGALTILLAIAFSFVIGSRVGWLTTPTAAVDRQPPQPPEDPVNSTPATKPKVASPAPNKASSKPGSTAPAPDELVVYEKGKVIFRMKPDEEGAAKLKNRAISSDAMPGGTRAVVEASSTKKIAHSQSVWLPPDQAEDRLLTRTEPQYPAEALASHRSGNVVLEIQVGEDGSVTHIRAVKGDPLLAAAAADAIRGWRYQPYRRHDRPSQFQTDVTMSFTLPN